MESVSRLGYPGERPGNTDLRTVELADQTLNTDDLKLFLQKFNPAAADKAPIFVPIDLDSGTCTSECRLSARLR